jgi:hypothetical protein
MKKKVAGFICVIAGVALIASCGGGTSAAQSAINSSVAALSDILDYVFNTCVDFPCACPGGGTVDWDGTTVTANGCKASNGETFTGTLADNGDSATVNFSVFGECTAVSGTVSGVQEDSCSGTITGACADESITCSMSSNCENCNI